MSDLPPADWYTDPEDESQYRYWDGSTWTEHRAPRHDQAAVEHEPESPQIRRPGQLLSDTFSLARRRWRSCVAAGLIYVVGEAVMVVLLIIGANDLLKGELGGIWDRVTDPAFDPESPEQTAYFESLEIDLAFVNFVPIVLGLLAFWIASNIMQAAVSRVAISDLRDQPMGTSDALRLALRRIPRLIGLDVQVTLIALIAMLLLILAAIGAPLLLIPLIPAFIVGLVYASVMVPLAYVVASVGPTTGSLAYGARLVRGRFWRTLGRMLVLLVVLTGVSLLVGLGIALAGSSTVTFEVVSQVVQALIGTVMAVVGLVAVAIIYHDLGGESTEESPDR